MRKCKEEGFFAGVSYIPVLPYLSDSEKELDEMIRTAKEYEADFVFVGALTLFGNKPVDCKTLYYKFLEKHHPDLVPKYRCLFRIFFQPSKNIKKSLVKEQKGCVKNMGLNTKLYEVANSKKIICFALTSFDAKEGGHKKDHGYWLWTYCNWSGC